MAGVQTLNLALAEYDPQLMKSTKGRIDDAAVAPIGWF
jgi:hypothetical protein